MEPEDLLCSRNARPQKALVERAQWKIIQPPSLRENKQAWREHVYRPMRAVKNNLPTPSVDVWESEGPGWTRAEKGTIQTELSVI